MIDEVVRAAGAVLWREGAHGPQIAVIHRPKYDDWSLPKGKLEPGETELQAALREVTEETGHVARPGAPLGEVRYHIAGAGGRAEKVVVYWAMRSAGGVFAPTREVDDLRWVRLDEALELLSHERDREVARRFDQVNGQSASG